MTQLLDMNSLLPIPCSECGSITKPTVAFIQQRNQVRCSTCGHYIDVDLNEFSAAIQRAEYLLHDIGRGLGRTFQKASMA